MSDRAAVMRDGRLVGSAPTSELSPERVVQMMVGRELLPDLFPKKEANPVTNAAPILQAKDLRRGRDLAGVSLALHPGEIVGLAGLVGAGRTFVARALFGADRLDGGEIWMGGRQVQLRSPRDAIRLGIGFVPEDRKSEGLFLGQSVRTNTAISILERLSRFWMINFKAVASLVNEMIQKLNVRTPNAAQRVRNLSGGNQQKVVIARWLALNPKILILDEPTRGVDVAAKAEIHALINNLAKQGMAILMISSELPEVLGISDRVLVMREGRLAAEFSRAEATQDSIMRAATGQTGAAAG
jgi:ribose transport system ATP-binding protein